MQWEQLVPRSCSRREAKRNMYMLCNVLNNLMLLKDCVSVTVVESAKMSVVLCK